jgi:phosphocarrier protein FPr/phosphocarrier protein
VVEAGAAGVVEQQNFTRATEEAAEQIETIKAQLQDQAKRAILSMHQELLQDPDLLALTYAGLADGKSAAWAWRAAFSAYSARLEAQDNALLRERANDIRDVGRRVLALLAGVKQSELDVPAGSILIAEDLAPSDTAALDPARYWASAPVPVVPPATWPFWPARWVFRPFAVFRKLRWHCKMAAR